MAILPKFFSKDKEKTPSVKKAFNGRASAKRLNSRVSDLEDKTQGPDNSQIHENEDTDFAEEFAKLTKNEKNRLINPLKIDNLSVTQVFAGWDKTDIRFAQRISIKNTRLLEKFTKAAEVIAKNTDYKKDQDTSIENQRKKKQNRLNTAVAQKKSKDGYCGESKGGLGLWALLGIGAKLLWDWMMKKWDWIMEKFGKIKKWIFDKIGKGWEWVMDKWTKAKDWITGNVKKGWKWLTGELDKAKKWVSGKVEKGWKWLTGELDKAKKWVSGNAKRGWNWLTGELGKVTRWIGKTTEGGWQWVADQKTKVVNWISKTWRTVYSQFEDAMKWAGDKAKKVKKVAKNVKNSAVKLKNKVVEGTKKVGTKVKEAAVKIKDKSIKIKDKVSKGVKKGTKIVKDVVAKGSKKISKALTLLNSAYSGVTGKIGSFVDKAKSKIMWAASKSAGLFKSFLPGLLKTGLKKVIGYLFVGALAVFAAPILGAIATAAMVAFEIWSAYTLAIDILIASGVLTAKQVEDAEDRALAFATLGLVGKASTVKTMADVDKKKVAKLSEFRKDRVSEDLVRQKAKLDELRYDLKKKVLETDTKSQDEAVEIRKKLLDLVTKYDKRAKEIGEPTYINTFGQGKWAFSASGGLENKKETTEEKRWFALQMEVAKIAKEKGYNLQQARIRAKNKATKSRNNVRKQNRSGSVGSGNNGGMGGQSNKDIGDVWLSPTVKAVHGKYDDEDYGTGSIDTGPRWVRYPNGVVKVGGSKAWRNNNPGNITGMSKKLLFGAIGIALSNTGDTGDRAQLVFSSTQAGFNAMITLMLQDYSSAPIVTAFAKYQTDKISFANKLADLGKHGISNNRIFSDLNEKERQVFVEVWAKWEGYKKGSFGGTRTGDRKSTTGAQSSSKATTAAGTGGSSGGSSMNIGAWGRGSKSWSTTNNDTISASGSVSDFASQFLGKSYSQANRGVSRDGNSVLTNSNSYDCSSFVGMIMQEKYGIPYSKFGKTTEPQFRFCRANFNQIQKSKIEEGDVIFYNHSGPGYVSHVAIAVSNSEMIHARGIRHGIQKTKIGSKNFAGAFRPAEGGKNKEVQNGSGQAPAYIGAAVKQFVPPNAVQSGANPLKGLTGNFSTMAGLSKQMKGLTAQMHSPQITNINTESPAKDAIPKLSSIGVLV